MELALLLTVLFAVAVSGYEQLAANSLLRLSSLDSGRLSLDNADSQNHFKHLNRTRVPSSKGSEYVQRYILSHFEDLNRRSSHHWVLKRDEFSEKGFNFTNIIATKEPASADNKYLVLAAHYDTLLHPEGFVGAIDSAVSCGILLDVAESISSLYDQFLEDEQYDHDVGLKLVFFDGEEAFERWSPTDSIYGARHLHSVWSKTGELHKIELFVLLDLLGSTDNNFIPSYFPQSHESYNDLSMIETRLVQVYPELFTSLQSKYLHESEDNFHPRYRAYMEDDHIPFLRSGVPILHLIPDIFPSIWHTIDDDFNHVDMKAISRWNLLLRAFVLEYLELDIQ